MMKQLGLVFTIVFATVAMASVTLDSTAVYAVQGQRSNFDDDSKPLPL